jgi:hypothetical protein
MNDLHRFVHEHNADSDSDGFDDSVVFSLHAHTNRRLGVYAPSFADRIHPPRGLRRELDAFGANDSDVFTLSTATREKHWRFAPHTP